jgi:hypothetical protein
MENPREYNMPFRFTTRRSAIFATQTDSPLPTGGFVMKVSAGIFAMLVSMVVIVSSSMAAESKKGEQEPYIGSAGFEQMKKLVGSWEGEMDMGEGPMKFTATYKLTSGGSAIVETLFEGAPNEMVTVYHDTPKRKLMMTHYCMLKNQPKMMLMVTEGNRLTFDLAKDAAIDPAKDKHMHAMSLMMTGADQMTQKWTLYDKGQSDHAVEIALKRVM